MHHTNHDVGGHGASPGYALSPLWQDMFPSGLLAELNAHPFLLACGDGSIGIERLRAFLIQHHYYAQYFTRYLCSLMGALPEQSEFKALSHNLAEELSGGDTVHVSHADLYRQAMKALSASPKSEPMLASTAQLIDTMFRYCRCVDPLDGLAALCLGAEAIVPLVYGPILQALRHLDAPDEAQLFFRIHVEEDEQHAIVMREIIDRMVAERPYRRARVVAVGEEMVRLRMAMLTELLELVGAASPTSAMMPPEGLQALRNDASLGSGNFFDRCYALNPHRDRPFLWVDEPFRLGDGLEAEVFSLDRLHEFRKALAGWYLTRGIGSGDVVAVCVGSGLAPFLHYLALTSLGAAISLLNPGMPADAGAAYMRKNGFGRLVVDATTLASSAFVRHWRETNAADGVIDVSSAAIDPDPHLPETWPFVPEDSTLVMLSHTSGTTGVPKAVRFEHRQFFMGKRARIGRFAESDDERLLTALPQSHSAAISHLETAVLHGIPTYVLGTQAGHAVRTAIRTFEPTTVLAFPTSFMLLVEGGVAENEFPSVRRWFSMGDAAHQSHTRCLLAGAPRARFIDAFGSSELGMALFRSESTCEALAPQRSIGRPVDIAVAKILDAQTGEEVLPGQIGLLAVRAPTITSGYWQQPAQTAGAWRGGYFLTGDVAFCKDGEFFQIDREVDVVASPAGPLYTLLLEEAAQQVHGVCDVAVVGVERESDDGPLVLALVLPERSARGRARELADGVHGALLREVQARGMALPDDAIAVAVVASLAFLPVGATGKVLKRLLRQHASSILRDAQTQGGHGEVLHLRQRAMPCATSEMANLGA